MLKALVSFLEKAVKEALQRENRDHTESEFDKYINHIKIYLM